MTTGSPLAAAVSGPGVVETNAIRRESGDHAIARPSKVSGLLVPRISATQRGAPPSAEATSSPSWPPALPEYAIHRPSGDHAGSDPVSPSPPTPTGRPSGSAATQSCVRGRPAPPLSWTV